MIVLAGDRRGLVDVRFLPPGPGLAAVGADGRVEFWDYSAGVVHRRWECGPTGGRHVFGPVPGGPRVHGPVTGRGLHVFDPSTGRSAYWTGFGPAAGFVRFAPAGDWVAYANRGGQLPVLVRAAVADGAAATEWAMPVGDQGGPRAVIDDLAVTPGGDRLIVAERSFADVRVSVRSAADGRREGAAEVPAAADVGLAVDPSATWVAAWAGGQLWVWPLADAGREPVRVWSRSPFTAVAFHPSGRWLAAARRHPTVRLYDSVTGRPVREYNWSAGKLRAVAFHPDGTLAAAGSADGRVVVWDVDV